MMIHANDDLHPRPASPPQASECASHKGPQEVSGALPQDIAQAQRDARYWTRLHHYMSLHSDDGLQLAKRHAMRDVAHRGAAPVSAVADAWKERHRNYGNFVAQRDAALQQIETELQAIGLPFERLFETTDFIPIDCNTGHPAKPPQ